MTLANKRYLIALIIVVVLGLAWYGLARARTAIISTDTTIAGDYQVKAGRKVVLKNGAKLTVQGKLEVAGQLVCDRGPLTIIGKGDIAIKKTVSCTNENTEQSGINIVAEGSFMLDENAEINSNGAVQIADSESGLATSPEQLNKFYEDAANPTGKNRVGPFGEGGASGTAGSSTEALPRQILSAQSSDQPASLTQSRTRPVASPPDPSPKMAGQNTSQNTSDKNINTANNNSAGAAARSGQFGIKTAQSQTETGIIKTALAHDDDTATIDIAGRIKIPTPAKGNNRPIIVFYFPGKSKLNIQNLDLEGPNGRPGDSDQGEPCNRHGNNGEPAWRFLAYAGHIKINNFTIKLGNGGKGGNAITSTDCYPKATAKAGDGGASGNMKMVADEGIEITGSLVINPGNGGDGGLAKATAKDGPPEQKGGSATATGGVGADNIKALGVVGAVGGLNNVEIGSSHGGNGGDATAVAGTGGAGTGCGRNGGPGGDATATAGKGGKASTALVGAAQRSPGAQDIGGNGGNASATAGAGGHGGNCGPEGPGGNGGDGSPAVATPGAGGMGKDQNGADGEMLIEQGGNGGDGGDGCGPGAGGKGGTGRKDAGKDGKLGKNLCIPPEEKHQTTNPPTGETNTPTSTGTTTGNGTTTGAGAGPTGTTETVKIKVIEYGGKYLPVDQLIIEAERGCDGGQAHWHAAEGVVKATDGSMVPDPGPQCGYGKQSDKPMMEVAVPK